MAHRAGGLALLFLMAASASALDLKNAVVVAPPSLTGPEKKAAVMLVDEIARRTRIRLAVVESWSGARPAILVSRESGLGAMGGNFAARLIPAAAGAEGYRVQVVDGVVLVVGNDARGTLFGVGGLLRHLRMERDSVDAPDDLALATAPKYRCAAFNWATVRRPIPTTAGACRCGSSTCGTSRSSAPTPSS